MAVGGISAHRQAKVPLWLAGRVPMEQFDPSIYIRSPRTTHNNPVCDAAAVLYSQTIFGVFDRQAPDGVFTIADALLAGLLRNHPQLELVGRAMRGDLSFQ